MMRPTTILSSSRTFDADDVAPGGKMVKPNPPSFPRRTETTPGIV